MQHEQTPTQQHGQLTWVDLPFLPANRRPAHLPTKREAVLDTVRLLVDEPPKHYQEHLIVEVDSDHMHPRLCEGDWLRCRPIPSEAWVDLPAGVYVVQAQNDFLIRRVKANDLRQRQVLTVYADHPRNQRGVDLPQAHLRQVWQVLEIVSGSIR